MKPKSKRLGGRSRYLISVFLLAIVVLPIMVKGGPELTVAPGELYPGESLYIGLDNTTANTTFVLYILQRNGHVVYEYENKTDANGTWSGDVFIATDETGYPELEFGDHIVQIMVNRSMVKKKFVIIYDDNYRWKIDQGNREADTINNKKIVDGVLLAAIIIFTLQTVSILALMVLILYLSFRTPKALKRLVERVGDKLDRWFMARKFPEARAHLERDKEDYAFHERKALKYEAQVLLNDVDRTVALVGRKMDRWAEIYKHFKGNLTKQEFYDVIRRENEIWHKSPKNARMKKVERDKIPGHTALPKAEKIEEGDDSE